MLTMKCFWAGQLVLRLTAYSKKELQDNLKELQRALSANEITHVSCRKTFILHELCVDVMRGSNVHALYSLSAE